MSTKARLATISWALFFLKRGSVSEHSTAQESFELSLLNAKSITPLGLLGSVSASSSLVRFRLYPPLTWVLESSRIRL